MSSNVPHSPLQNGDSSEYLIVAKFGKPYGIKGYIKIYFYSDSHAVDRLAPNVSYF